MKKRKKKNKTQPKKSKNLLHTHTSLEPKKKKKTMKKNYKYPIKIRIKNQKEHKEWVQSKKNQPTPLYLWVLKWQRRRQLAYLFQLAMTFCNSCRKKSSWDRLWWWKSYQAVDFFWRISRPFLLHCDTETEFEDCSLQVRRFMYETVFKWE